MDAIDNGHQRPEDQILGLGGQNSADNAAPACSLERGPEDGSIRHVQDEGARGRAARQPAEQADVGVRRSKDPP
jgi:hypothetical protein